jgi:hypothetical protein
MDASIEARVAITAGLLLAAAQEAGMMITGDMRVAEQDAATLLGLSPRYLAQLRRNQAGQYPVHD